jgi:hypothetical protein
MGRPRTTFEGYPPRLHKKRGRFYYGKEGLALGADPVAAMKRYAELEALRPKSSTMEKLKKLERYPKCPLCGRRNDYDERYRSTSRSIANVAVKRGKLVRQPCEKCGADNAEKHHDDYKKPLEVRWLCRACHVEHHKAEQASA